ncbi:hypothetical protein KVV02_000105 [Mortierella alpina]|uniref:F-box domain-containing protein n=1 Tax=Mortierella alpina TaxID=64518 RepID=A0A9P8CUB8_MORAP|nr:hypothetical protein KVV02_000105 [Mortierella alpina]
MASLSSLFCTEPASTSTLTNTTTTTTTTTTIAAARSATFTPILLCASLRVLHLPELLHSIGQFLSHRDALACVLVCRTWLHAFEPLVWKHIETANKIPSQDLERHAHDIRSLSLAGLVEMDRVLKRCTRLETVILWPEAFEEEEDDAEEEEDDEEDVDVDEEEDTEQEEGVESSVDTAQWGAGLQGDAHGEENVLRLFPLRLAECARSAGRARVEKDDRESLGGSNSDDEGDDNERVDGPGGGRELMDKEKLRRDSGVGQDTLEAEVSSLGISHASTSTIAGPEYVDQQQQQQQQQQEQWMAGFWSPSPPLHLTHLSSRRRPRRMAYQSPLVSLLLQNRNLRRVEVYVERKSPGGSFWRALAAAPSTSTRNSDPSSVRPCPLVSSSRNSTSSQRSSFCPCPRLSSFQSLVNLQVHKHIDSFLQMCTRLESLDLERCTLRQLEPEGYGALWFTRLRELKLGRIREMSLLSQLLLMRQCPELEVLDWRVPHLGFPLEEFCQALEEGRWPKLKSLTLPESRLADDELARILYGAAVAAASGVALEQAVVSSISSSRRTTEAARAVMEPGSGRASASSPSSSLLLSSWPSTSLPSSTPSLTNGLLRCHITTTALRATLPSKGLSTFAVRRSDFGPLAFSALQQHFSTLQSLDLYQCPALTSAMTQKILMNCPLLQSFDGNRLLAKDIVHGLSVVLRRRPLDHPSCSFGAGASGTTSTEWAFDHHNQQQQNQQKEEDESTVEGGWVCKGLRYLDVHITGFSDAGISAWMDVEGNGDSDTTIDENYDGDEDEDGNRACDHVKGSKKSLGARQRQLQWTVFSQLAQLNQLAHLSVGGKSTLRSAATSTTTTVQAGTAAGTPALSSASPSSPVSSPVPGVGAREAQSGAGVGGDGLEMNLRSGLGQLRTLRKLRMLRFTGLQQHMEQEDVAWMVEQLPELRVVQGRLHFDGNRQAALEARLEAGDVSAWTMYNPQ